jgi:hypothetical protein
MYTALINSGRKALWTKAPAWKAGLLPRGLRVVTTPPGEKAKPVIAFNTAAFTGFSFLILHKNLVPRLSFHPSAQNINNKQLHNIALKVPVKNLPLLISPLPPLG